MEHTPTPWHACVHGHIWNAGKTTNIASTWTTPNDDYPEGRPYEANAEFIVRACNAHDELVRALEVMINAYGNKPKHTIDQAESIGISALKKARGEA